MMINFEMLEREVESLSDRYINGEPFECIVIDGFLTKAGLTEIDVKTLMTCKSSRELSSDFIFAKNKIENPLLEDISEGLSKLKSELLSERFRQILSQIVCKDVFIDPSFVGGGLHQGLSGSYLDMHADFTRHPTNRKWIRELNLLLYLNKDWQSQFGGRLDLKNSETGEELSIEPLENRMVIMLTKPHTIHGYKAINFPDGKMRTSVAAYAYSTAEGNDLVPYESTRWYPQNRMRNFLSRITNKIVPIKQKLFGSRTAARARRK